MTGIDGNYRMTCESVMRVLRAHKDSVMAVLEAFVYDPLLNWRLIDCKFQIMNVQTSRMTRAISEKLREFLKCSKK